MLLEFSLVLFILLYVVVLLFILHRQGLLDWLIGRKREKKGYLTLFGESVWSCWLRMCGGEREKNRSKPLQSKFDLKSVYFAKQKVVPTASEGHVEGSVAHPVGDPRRAVAVRNENWGRNRLNDDELF